MDPLAHTLVGAGLSETGLKRWTPLATATLVIGANLPDIDAIVTFAGSDLSLLHRRGWTHGVLALIVLPSLLALAMHAFGRRHDPSTSLPRLLALAYLAVVSHPLLDLLNTYGVRLLMPFDGRWFYGDTLFIIDPLMWLLAGAGVIVGGALLRQRAWIVLGALTSVMVLATGIAPWSARLVWLFGIGVIVWLKSRERWRRRSDWVARVALTALVSYIVAMRIGSGVAREQASAFLIEEGIDGEVVMAGPRPARPFEREVVAVTGDEYLFLEIDWLGDERVGFVSEPLPRQPPDRIVRAALEARSIRGFRNWMRFPSYEVEELDDGYRVLIRDVRYGSERRSGFGTAVVELDRELRPRR